jgi:hypothetical protein
MRTLFCTWTFFLLLAWQWNVEIELLSGSELFLQKDMSDGETEMVIAYQTNLVADSNSHADSVPVAILMPSPVPSPTVPVAILMSSPVPSPTPMPLPMTMKLTKRPVPSPVPSPMAMKLTKRPVPSPVPSPMAMKLTKRPAQRHSVKKPAKKCPCCGGQHSLQQCKLPGAKLIQKLRAMKRTHTDNRKKLKHTPKKSVSYAKKATQKYSQTPKPKDVRHLFQRKKQGAEASAFEKRLEVASTALEELQKAGFVGKVHTCKHCKHRSLTQVAKPREGRDEDVLFYRCTRKKCKQCTSVLENSPWHEMKIGSNMLAKTLLHICRQPWTKAVSATGIVSNVVGMGRLQAQHVLDALRLAEAQCAQKRQKTMKLSGNLEADATGIRSLVVKRSNPNYKDTIADYERRRSQQDHYRVWVRLLGVSKRGSHQILIAPIEDKVVALDAKPPPESIQEIEASGLLGHIKKPAVVFSDGAQSWPSALRGKRLRGAAVSHKDKEFTRHIEKAEQHKGLSKVAGTQSLDRRWGVLCNQYIPYTLHAKVRENGVSDTNQNLFTYCWSWALRYNLNDAGRGNLWKSLGQAVSSIRKK